MTDYPLVGLCGSLRRASYNRMLMREAARLYGGPFLEADLNLPLMNEDLQNDHGIPPAVERLARQIKAADAVLVVTPEYNKSLSGVMKNALDWISRVPGGVWRDKPVAVMSAAAGRAGGERAQYALRLCLTPFRARVLPGPEVLVGGAKEQFDENGRLIGERYRKSLTELMDELRREAVRCREAA